MAASWNSLRLSFLMRHARTHRIYFIPATGTPIPMEGEYGSPGFLAEHARLSLGRKAKRAQEIVREEAVEAGRARLPAEGYVSQLLDRWQATNDYGDVSRQTRDARDRHVASIRTAFGRLSQDDLETIKRAKFYDWRKPFEDRPETARKHQGTLSAFLNWAVEESLLRHNPAQRLKHVKNTNPRGRADINWTRDDETAFLAAASPALADLVRLALLTGARLGDLCRMTLANLRRDGNQLWLEWTPRKTSKSTGQPVPLPCHLLPPLEALVLRLADAAKAAGRQHLIVTEYGKPRSAQVVYRHMAETRLRAGIARNLRFNDLRSTANNRMTRAGVDGDRRRAVLGKPIGDSMRNYDEIQALTEEAFKTWAASFTPSPISPPAGRGKVLSFRRRGGLTSV